MPPAQGWALIPPERRCAATGAVASRSASSSWQALSVASRDGNLAWPRKSPVEVSSRAASEMPPRRSGTVLHLLEGRTSTFGQPRARQRPSAASHRLSASGAGAAAPALLSRAPCQFPGGRTRNTSRPALGSGHRSRGAARKSNDQDLGKGGIVQRLHPAWAARFQALLGAGVACRMSRVDRAELAKTCGQ